MSCNEAPDGDKWCCKCAKCAFVFILMSAWCSEAQLVEIFGENLFEKQSIFSDFLSLLDEEGVKPMECVGTACETWLSLYLALRVHGESTFLKAHEEEIRRKEPSSCTSLTTTTVSTCCRSSWSQLCANLLWHWKLKATTGIPHSTWRLFRVNVRVVGTKVWKKQDNTKL